MDAWIIERIERDRREQQRDQREQLRIQPPPAEWLEYEERRRKDEDDKPSDRGVWIIEF